mgnify:CR=1 FL=1
MSLTLRTYQTRAISDLRIAYRQGARAPLLVLPTGAGKTVVFAEIVRAASERGRRALVLVHRRELILQASAKLQLAGVEHGIIAAGFNLSSHPVQVASVQTLVRRLQQIDWQPDLIVIDEAHHAAAGSWERVLSHWPDAYRLGVSATPVRLDGRGLSDAFDHLVLGPSVADLIECKFLTPARIYAPPVVADLSAVRIRAGDYANDQAAAAMDRPSVTGDAIDHYQRLAGAQQAIAFCCSVAHANSVCAAFLAAGIRAVLLLGTTENRDQIVADFGAGLVQILVTVDVVSEGFDVPAASCAILLRPTQSESLYLQQVGRVLRPAPGKPHAVILDHVGNVHRHGFPDDHREWTLDDARKRVRTLSGQAPSVRTCEQCFAAFKPQPICPVCGAITQPSAREIKQCEGELQELNRQAIARARIRDRRQQGAARTLPELMAIAKQRGYSPGWAYKVHNARSRSA